MKREYPSLFAALLVSLLVNVLLRSQTAYWPRAGLFSAVVCAPLLAGVGWLFARSWRLAADPVYKLLFGALLVYTSVLELLRLWQLADRLYPGAVTLTSVCLLVVLLLSICGGFRRCPRRPMPCSVCWYWQPSPCWYRCFRGCASSICKLPH